MWTFIVSWLVSPKFTLFELHRGTAKSLVEMLQSLSCTHWLTVEVLGFVRFDLVEPMTHRQYFAQWCVPIHMTPLRPNDNSKREE